MSGPIPVKFGRQFILDSSSVIDQTPSLASNRRKPSNFVLHANLMLRLLELSSEEAEFCP